MKNKRSWLLSFLMPFLIVGTLTVWHWYDYSLKDFQTGRMKYWKEGDKIQQPGDNLEALKIALLFGLPPGAGAGALGVGIYGLAKLIKRKF